MENLYSALNTCFPRAGGYFRIPEKNAVYEAAAPFRRYPYHERHIQCTWADDRHRPTGLKTTTGATVTVEDPGTWNLEAGPDFLNAVLLIDDERITGDLEIHIHPSSWKQHGHADDPRYSDVCFHVTYFDGPEIPGLLHVPLQKLLAENPRFSFDHIDTSAYPYSVPTGNFPLKGMHPDQRTEWLESAGEERLHLKAERFALALQSEDPDQLLYTEILSALGYKNNKAPFRKLATILPLAQIRALANNETEAYALLIGTSGLLANNLHPEWDLETRQYFRSIWDIWWKQEELKKQALKKEEWNFSGIRPTNHPARRMMAAAHYAMKLPTTVGDLTLSDNEPEFWTTHLNWEHSCSPTALVGESRANAMLINVVIPWLAATNQIDPFTSGLLKRLPIEPSNSIIRQTAHVLFGPDHNPKDYRSALARQGLIQIFHDYVITHRLEDLKNLNNG